jgi:hypothetical protein
MRFKLFAHSFRVLRLVARGHRANVFGFNDIIEVVVAAVNGADDVLGRHILQGDAVQCDLQQAAVEIAHPAAPAADVRAGLFIDPARLDYHGLPCFELHGRGLNGWVAKVGIKWMLARGGGLIRNQLRFYFVSRSLPALRSGQAVCHLHPASLSSLKGYD